MPFGQSVTGIDQFMETTVEQVSSLNYQLPSFTTAGQAATLVPVPVTKKYLPKRSQQLDSPTQITVFRSDEPETLKYAGFKGKQWLTYLVYVVLVTPGNQDLASNLDNYHQWRNKAMSLFLPNGPNGYLFDPIANNGMFGIQGLWEIRVVPDVFLPRQQLSQEYNYMAFGLKPKFSGA